MSYAAKRGVTLSIPKSFERWQVADLIYGKDRLFHRFLRCESQRFLARKQLGRILESYGLPPLQCKPLVIDPMLRGQIGCIRKLVYSCLLQVRCYPARKWLQSQVRFVFGARAAWRDHINAKQHFTRFRLQDFQNLSAAQLAERVSLASLRGHAGLWSLTEWPSREKVFISFREQWWAWSRRHNLPARVCRGVQRRLPQFFSHVRFSSSNHCHGD